LVKTDIVRAQGCYLYDADGKRYVDFEAGVWCAALGHNHPRVNQALGAQIERLAHIGYRYTNVVVEEAAAAVLGTLPLAGGKVVFLSSGSEAVEFGVQVARRITGQPLFLTLSDSYLAAFGSAGTKSASEWHIFDWSECIACPHADECDPQCPRLSEVPWQRIGGLAFEPGNSSGLVRLPPGQLVQALASRVQQQGGLLVVDEVTTGLGRTGAWYGFEHYALQPDVVALGKGLGNGYPVSAVAMSSDVAASLAKSDFHYAQSHQNDPLACAVAREVLAVLREQGLVKRSARVGARFLRDLEQIGTRHASVKDVRGRGLMIVLEFEGDDESFSLNRVYRELLARGFMAGFKPAARILRFYPPLTISEQDIAGLVENLDQVLSA
jgi:acetylornithine aminotransferase